MVQRAEKLLAEGGVSGGRSPRQQRVGGAGREPSRREQEGPLPHDDYSRSTCADARHPSVGGLADARHPSPSQADLRHVSRTDGALFETSIRQHPTDAEEYEGSNGGGEERREANGPSPSGGPAKLHLHIKHASLRGAFLPAIVALSRLC